VFSVSMAHMLAAQIAASSRTFQPPAAGTRV